MCLSKARTLDLMVAASCSYGRGYAPLSYHPLPLKYLTQVFANDWVAKLKKDFQICLQLMWLIVSFLRANTQGFPSFSSPWKLIVKWPLNNIWPHNSILNGWLPWDRFLAQKRLYVVLLRKKELRLDYYAGTINVKIMQKCFCCSDRLIQKSSSMITSLRK